MAMDFLSPATRVKALEVAGETAMRVSLAKGMPHGYSVSLLQTKHRLHFVHAQTKVCFGS
jgi:hypothetical protein